MTGQAVPSLESYDRLIPAFMRKWGLPGGAVAVVKNGRLVLARGYGLADVERRERVLPDSLFRLASVSKPITAVALLKLAEQGRVRLDAKVFDVFAARYPLPKEPAADRRLAEIRIDQLLHHTAGFDSGRGFDPMFRSVEAAEVMGVRPPATSDAIIRYMLWRPLDYSPGQRFAYSNFGYCLLGRVIEQATGRSYEESVRELVLKPCGIERMRLGRTRLAERVPGEVRYYPDGESDLARSVFPGEANGVPWPYGGFYLEAMDSHGGWIGSAVDLARFVTAVDGRRGPALLKPESIAQMVARPEPPVSVGAAAYYGLGWNIRPVGKVANWWHNGSLPGTSTLLVRAAEGLSWTVVFNARPRENLGPFNAEMDQLLWQAAREVRAWPEHDLFKGLESRL
ncbi:MAG: serine hydrolase domain-containing protein [Pirellulales bacterium]